MSDQNQNPNPKLIRKSSVSQALPPNPEIPAHTQHVHVSDKTLSEFNQTVETKDAGAVAETVELIQKLQKIRFWIVPAVLVLLALVVLVVSVIILGKFLDDKAFLAGSIVVLIVGSCLCVWAVERLRNSQRLHWNNLCHRLKVHHKQSEKARQAIFDAGDTFPRLREVFPPPSYRKKKST